MHMFFDGERGAIMMKLRLIFTVFFKSSIKIVIMKFYEIYT